MQDALADRARGRDARLLFVCLGNICRSPTAEGVMREMVSREGLLDSVQIESAGTGAWHVGSAPDRRASAAARAHGVTLEGSARQVTAADFEDFDLLLAMDRQNARELRARAQDEQQRAKVRLLREFDPASVVGDRHAVRDQHVASDRHVASDQHVVRDDLDVPDPYYGGADGFDEVFALVRAACEGLLEQILAGRAP
jgi:protein-tyrosine phosphatase